MRTLILLAFCAIGASAQDSTISLPEGATLAVRLDRTVSTAHAHPGDSIEATLLAPVLARGIVLIPNSAKVRGHVLVAESRSGGNASRLMIRFEQAGWRHSTVPINAYLIRQLVVKNTVVFGANHSPCPSSARMFYQRGGSSDNKVPLPRASYAPCDERLGVTQQARSEKIVFVSPRLKDMQLLRAAAPPGATALVSTKKNVKLGRGTVLEIRHTTP